MSAILSFLVSNPTMLAIGGGIVAMVFAWTRGRVSGAAAERTKQATTEVAARDIKDQVQNDIGALPPAEAREELGKWSKR